MKMTAKILDSSVKRPFTPLDQLKYETIKVRQGKAPAELLWSIMIKHRPSTHDHYTTDTRVSYARNNHGPWQKLVYAQCAGFASTCSPQNKQKRFAINSTNNYQLIDIAFITLTLAEILCGAQVYIVNQLFFMYSWHYTVMVCWVQYMVLRGSNITSCEVLLRNTKNRIMCSTIRF